MKLSGNHTTLRSTILADAEQILDWENDPTNWLVSDTIAPYSLNQIETFIEKQGDLYSDQQLRLMIETPEGKTAGCIDLFDFDPKNQRVGMGILIDQDMRGKGIGKDAISTLVKYCLEELEIHMLYAEVPESNDASKSLFESAGFKLNGRKQDWLWDGQSFIDQMIYQYVAQG